MAAPSCIDSPFHRYEDGKDISELNLESLASLEGVKVVVDGGSRNIKLSESDLRNPMMLLPGMWLKRRLPVRWREKFLT